MTSQNLRSDIYDPKTLAVMDQAFAAIWNVLRADDPFRDYANDSELRLAIGQKLLNLVADGVTDPGRLRQMTVESLLLARHWGAQSRLAAHRRRIKTSVQSFIQSENIKNFKKRLDGKRSEKLSTLLEEE
jgi:hypothetical protein